MRALVAPLQVVHIFETYLTQNLADILGSLELLRYVTYSNSDQMRIFALFAQEK